jgi:hypothetical protein
MDDDTLFLESLRDIRGKSDSNNPRPEYEAQQLGWLLRKLLMDGHPLIDLANRKHRLPIRFLVDDGSPYQDMVLSMGPVFYSLVDAFDPRDSAVANARVAEVDREGLLARRILLLQGEWYSVKDIIKYVAQVEGAVHRGQPSDAKERALLESGIGIGGYAPASNAQGMLRSDQIFPTNQTGRHTAGIKSATPARNR